MANREDDPDLPKDGMPLPEETTKPRNRLRILVQITAAAGIFGVALAGSWFLREHFSEEEKPPAKVEHSTAPPKKTEPPGSPAEILERGDQALVQHRFAQAVGHYEELLESQPDSVALVAYRIGLCNESLGQLDKAHAAYRKAIGTAATPVLTLAAHLGAARCLLRDQHPADARRVLSPFLLEETRLQGVPEPLRAGMRYLVGLAYSNETLPPAAGKLNDDTIVSVTAASLEIPLYLDEISASTKANQETTVETLAPPLSIKKQPNPMETMILRIEQSEQPAAPLLERLAAEAGLTVEWTDEAKKYLEGRNLSLALHNWPLVEVFDQVADRFDLVVMIDGTVVRISLVSQTDARRVALARQEATKRALKAALLVDADHRWAPAAALELGNGEAAYGKSAKAAIWYERLIRNAPASAQAAPACFNLALLHARNHEHLLARQTWFRVVDYVPGHELALRAYLRIAQSYLEEENPQEAIVQLRRAQAFAPGSRYRPVATLLLAAAHLQKEEPANTRLVLAKFRTELFKDPYRPTATFLDAYAEYRLAKSANGGRREASELLESLWNNVDDNPLGPFGDGLIARAFLDLGFGEQAEQRLRQALKQTRGPYVPALEYSLGEALLQRDRRADAVVIFEKLAAAASPYRARARFQLAKVDLEEKRYAECEEKCRQIWTEQPFADPAPLLQVWGNALEGLGDFAKAAKCFAGQAPE